MTAKMLRFVLKTLLLIPIFLSSVLCLIICWLGVIVIGCILICCGGSPGSGNDNEKVFVSWDTVYTKVLAFYYWPFKKLGEWFKEQWRNA